MNDQDKSKEELSVDLQEFSFNDIFNLVEVQHLQDLFADAQGVASIILDTEGKPITQPSNFTRLCENIIRKTEKGCANCFLSDSIIGHHHPAGAVVQPCLSGGLWDAGASITVGGRHIANWLIGQVRNNQVEEQRIMQYADEIGADNVDFKEALNEVPVMSSERFQKIADLLFVFARDLSEKAFSMMQLGRQVAEKERANALLQEREENLSTTLHSIGDGVISTDKNGLVIQMNPVAETLCGWKLSEAFGKPLSEVFTIINAENRQIVADPVIKVLEKGEIVGLANHTVLVSRNGTEYQISDSAAPIKNKEGVITGVVLVFSDITESYITQRRIRESEERYRSLLNNLEAGIVVHAPDTSIVMNNPRACDLLGLSDDQMRGKEAMDPAWKFVNEDNIPLSLDEYPVNRIVNCRQPIKDQILGIHQPNQNDVVWVTVNGCPVLDPKGEITEIVISFIDITQRKQEEIARREADELFKHVFDYSNVGKSITSPNGVINVNKAFCNLLGYNKEELRNKKWQEITHPDDLELSQYEVNKIRGGAVDQVRFNKRFLHKNGSVIWVDLSSSAFLNNTGELQLISTVIDITESKRSELLLKEKTEEIEAQNEELNQTNQKLAEAKEIAEKNEARLKMALRVSKSGAWDWNIQKKSFYWSDEFLQLFGLPENTVAGFEAWAKALHPDDIEKASLKIQEAIENHTELLNDYRIILPNNEIRWIRTTGNVTYVNNEPQRMIGLCMDITQQKMSEQELYNAKERAEESERLLAKIADNYPNSFVSVIEKDLTVGFSGGQEFKRQNLNPNDFVGLTLEQVFGGFTEIVKENYLSTFSGKETSFELFINNQYQLYKTVPLVDEHNHITRILSVVENITESKQTEKALKESEERFKNMFERHSSVMLLVAPESGMITGANESSVRFYGYSKSELLAMNIDQINILSPEQVKMELQHALHEERSYFVFPHRLASGEVRTVEVHSSPIILQDQKILFSIIHDITERKHLEKIREIQYNIATAVVTSDSIGQLLEFVRSELSQMFNTTNFFAALYNAKNNTLKKLHWFDEVDEFEEWEASKSFSGYVVKTGKMLLLNKQEIEKLGAEQNIPIMGEPAECWLGVPLVVDKRTIGVLVIQSYTDPKAYDASSARLFEQVAYDLSVYIEKSRILQELNVAKLHAEESDRLKSAFLANMSHEIRTPMNGILGFAEILKDPELTGEQQREYIKIIEKSGNRMLNIINDIIDISKIESGLIKLDIKESNINDQIEYIYTFFKPEAEAKGIKLSIKTTLLAKEATLKTDREKVYAILTNLVKNAIKYTPAGSIEFGYDLIGSQILTSQKLKTEHPLFLQFYVKDTGIGIAANRQEAIFERFIQADITDKMARQGAGLGLAITKSYVEMLGGRIWVESQEGIGSTFYFTLPYNAEPEEKAIAKTSDFADGIINTTKTLKILIAEDDEASEMLITLMVNVFCKEKLKVRTGLEAVETSRKNPDIDLVLMDIQMPVMGGYEAIRQIREFNKNVIIIAQTAYGLSGDREKAIDAGCNDYIAKPINKAELQAMILKYFG